VLVDALIIAAAGGGSSGFGGGGGGGGGFSGGGGSGSGGGDPVVVLVVIVAALLFFAFGMIKALRLRRKRRERVAAVELASAVAADEDEAFAAERVRAEAERLYRDVQAAWDARDVDRLSTFAAPDLIAEWHRRLADFERKGWHNRVELTGAPEVEYVGLVNRDGHHDDRVVVRISCAMRDYVETRDGKRIMKDDEADEDVTTSEYWTLHKRDGAWRLESIEQDAEGAHHLDAEVVATPWADTTRLRDAAVAERAAADAAPPGFAPAELADLDFDGTARAAALDLALADGRFDPDLIEASVRRAVEAWARAVDGDDAALRAHARPAAIDALLHPGDAARQTRLVVRGPRIEAVRIASLDAAAAPATLGVELRVNGRRYIEDRDTAAVLSGSREAERSFTEHWTLALDGEGEWPWRIAAAGVPAH
jgi:predicted lipid-binding transport protein (Tim44 family)